MNLVELGLYFALLSLVSVGGLPSVMPEMQRYVVDVKGLAHAVGLHPGLCRRAGRAGPQRADREPDRLEGRGAPRRLRRARIDLLPAAVIAWWVAELWDRFKDSPWRKAIQRAIAPIVVGMILSGGVVLATPGSPDWRLWLIAAIAAAGMLATKLNPLWFLGAGAALGALLL